MYLCFGCLSKQISHVAIFYTILLCALDIKQTNHMVYFSTNNTRII